MKILKCWLTLRTFQVKKICPISKMPKSAVYYTTIFVENQSFDIWKTPNFVYFAKYPQQ